MKSKLYFLAALCLLAASCEKASDNEIPAKQYRLVGTKSARVLEMTKGQMYGPDTTFIAYRFVWSKTAADKVDSIIISSTSVSGESHHDMALFYNAQGKLSRFTSQYFSSSETEQPNSYNVTYVSDNLFMINEDSVMTDKAGHITAIRSKEFCDDFTWTGGDMTERIRTKYGDPDTHATMSFTYDSKPNPIRFEGSFVMENWEMLSEHNVLTLKDPIHSETTTYTYDGDRPISANTVSTMELGEQARKYNITTEYIYEEY